MIWYTEFLKIKHSILLKIRNMMDIKVDLLQWFIIFLIKTSDSGINNEIKQNEQLFGEPRKPNIRKFEKGGVYFLFQYNIYIYIFLFFWGGGGG